MDAISSVVMQRRSANVQCKTDMPRVRRVGWKDMMSGGNSSAHVDDGGCFKQIVTTGADRYIPVVLRVWAATRRVFEYKSVY